MHKRLCSLFLKTFAWWSYGLIFILSTSLALGVETKPVSFVPSTSLTDQAFQNLLKQYVGIPYRRGGTTTKGLDCSGFVRLVYAQIFGIELPHSSMAQFKFSDLKKIDKNDMQPGDLIFFANKGKKRINHVGVYMADNKFIHASSSNGIRVSKLNEKYWKKRFVGTKRHEDLASGFDSGGVRFESALQIPLYENGSIISYIRNDFKLPDSAFSWNQGTSTLANLKFDDSRESLYEIGYAHTLSESFDINVSTIHENFEVLSVWPDFTPKTQDSDYLLYDALPGTADRLGFKLAGVFQTSLGLSITPSVTFYDYTQENQDILNAPEWQFGLNTVLLPAHQQWSLSMMLQYAGKDDFEDLSDTRSRFSSLGLAVRLGIRLTDSLKFSIMGEHEQASTFYGVKGGSMIMDSKSSNVSMAFDFTY